MSLDVVQYGTGTPDSRMPFIPTDDYLQVCLENNVDYPSPYPEEIYPSLFYAKNNIVKSDEAHIHLSSSIMHSMEKTELFAATYIELELGSILVGQEIILKAPIIKIVDDNQDWPIRTTLVAKSHLYIEADKLLIDGADIFAGKCTLKVKQCSLKNITENTRWLGELVKQNSETCN